jgi:hypothetical protein
MHRKGRRLGKLGSSNDFRDAGSEAGMRKSQVRSISSVPSARSVWTFAEERAPLSQPNQSSTPKAYMCMNDEIQGFYVEDITYLRVIVVIHQ